MYLTLLVDEQTAQRIQDGERIVGAIYYTSQQTAYLRPYAKTKRSRSIAYSRSTHGCVKLTKKELRLRVHVRRDERISSPLHEELMAELKELSEKAKRLLLDEQGMDDKTTDV